MAQLANCHYDEGGRLASALPGGESAAVDFHPPSQEETRRRREDRLKKLTNSLYFKKRPQGLSLVQEFLQNGTQEISFGERTKGLKERP